jgi:hypothetical protein
MFCEKKGTKKLSLLDKREFEQNVLEKQTEKIQNPYRIRI